MSNDLNWVENTFNKVDVYKHSHSLNNLIKPEILDLIVDNIEILRTETLTNIIISLLFYNKFENLKVFNQIKIFIEKCQSRFANSNWGFLLINLLEILCDEVMNSDSLSLIEKIKGDFKELSPSHSCLEVVGMNKSVKNKSNCGESFHFNCLYDNKMSYSRKVLKEAYESFVNVPEETTSIEYLPSTMPTTVSSKLETCLTSSAKVSFERKKGVKLLDISDQPVNVDKLKRRRTINEFEQKRSESDPYSKRPTNREAPVYMESILSNRAQVLSRSSIDGSLIKRVMEYCGQLPKAQQALVINFITRDPSKCQLSGKTHIKLSESVGTIKTMQGVVKYYKIINKLELDYNTGIWEVIRSSQQMMPT